jgi:TonB-linked SusC/RagA family outer membrane protein
MLFQPTFGRITTNDDVDKSPSEATYQEKSVSGTVRSLEDGSALPGVNIIEKGTSNGTITDASGQYKLIVGEGAVLMFSSVGFLNQEIAVGNQAVIDMEMSVDITRLEELVVVGYGTQRKADLTGSVSSVSSKMVEEVPVNSLDRALQGRAAGVNVQQQSNTPNGDVRIRIRGLNSINGDNNPLYVIDGIIGADLNTVNPSDIQSIDVLKDAAAASIYGARGANGVIMVTTKKGKAGKPKARFDMWYGIQAPAELHDMMNAQQYMEYVNDANVQNNTGLVPYPNISSVVGQIGAGTQWQDEMFKNGSDQNYSLSLSGGNESVTYLASAGYQDIQGLIPNSNWNRFTARMNLDVKVTDALSFGSNISYVRTNANSFQEEQTTSFPNWSGPVSYTVSNPPLLDPRDANGNLIPLMSNDFADVATQLYNNGIYQAENEKRNELREFVQMTFYGKWQIIEQLAFRVQVGLQPTLGENRYFNPLLVPNDVQNQIRSASKSHFRNNQWLVEPTLTYTDNFADRHNLTVVVGSSTQKFSGENTSASSQEFPFDFVEWNALESGLAETFQVNSGLTEWQYVGIFGRINYEYDNRYLLQLNGRYDGSSRFAEGNKWAFFPSVAAGWRLSEEAFLESSSAIDNLKLRASYGSIGSPAIAPYSTIPRLGQNGFDSHQLGGQAVNSWITRLTNPDLKWETTTQFNVGLDLGFLDGRLNFTLDYYNKKTTDLILGKNVTIVNNAWRDHDPSITSNLGSMRNTGFEFNGDFTTDLGRSFTWDINLNFATQQNEVLDLALEEGTEFIDFGNNLIRNYHRLQEGEPFGNYVGYVTDGLYQTQEEINNSAQPGAQPGDIKHVDTNLDDQVNENDKTIVGNAIPDVFGGLTNTFRYKGFEFSFMFYGAFGHQLFNMGAQRFRYGLSEVEWNKFADVATSRWTGPNTSNDIPRAGYQLINGTDGPNGTIDIATEDASFVKLRNLVVAYNFPGSVTSKLGLGMLRIYFKGQNLLVFTKYSGYDPEQSNFRSSEVLLPLETALYPFVRTYYFGLNLEF